MQITVPRYPPQGSGNVKQSPRRFSVALTIGGHEVVDFDGRAVTEVPLEDEAYAIMGKLNDAAAGGAVTLARAIQAL